MPIQLFIAVGIFVIAVLVTVEDLATGFLFFLVLVPLLHKELFSLVVWDVLPVRIAFAGIVLSSFYRFYLWFRHNREKGSINRIVEFFKSDYVLILMSVLWLVRLVSILNSSQLAESFKLFTFYSLIVYLYILFKVLLLKNGMGFVKKATNLYLILGVGTALFAIVQLYFRLCCKNTIGAVWVNPGHLPRLGSSFWDVNHYGGFLVTLIPLSFSLLFTKKRFFGVLAMIISTSLFVAVLGFTGSRSSWMGLAFASVISLIVYWRAKLYRPLKFLLLIGVVSVAGLFGFVTYKGISIRDEVASYMHYRLDSTDTHILLLEGAGQIFVNNFVLGAGYGDFDSDFRETSISVSYFDREPRLRETKVPPHSVWGEVLAETGAIGIVVYCSLILFILSSVITAIKETKKESEKYLGLGILWGSVGLLIAGLFYSFNLEFFWIYLFFGIGFSYSVLKQNWNLGYVVKWWYKQSITPYLIIVPISAAYIFIKVGSTTLIDWDEAIYAKVAKNILMTGDWLNLHWASMKDYWFEKPPLYMWLTAIVFKVTGFNAFGARIVSAFFGLLGIIFTYEFGRKLYNKLVGIISAFVLLSTVQYLYYSRNGMLDVTVTFFILATVYFFYRVTEYKDKKDLKTRLLFGVLTGMMLGLGVMTKAIIGLLPIPIVGIYFIYLAIKDRKMPFNILDVLVVCIPFLLIVLPWHIYSYLAHGEKFLDVYLFSHILKRGLSGFGHEKPIWWFLEVIKVSFRIWIFPLIAGIASLWFIDKGNRKQFVYLCISAFIVLAFFSISKDKLQWYIMPVYPFIAVIAGRFMERFVVLINGLLRNDVKLEPIYMRSALSFLIILTSVFYIVIMRGRIYFPDFNKDKIALVEIFNDRYPLDQFPNLKLYYNSISEPILLFYSDHDIDPVNDRDEIYELIEQSDPDQFRVFLIKEDLYYKVNPGERDVGIPLKLEVKGTEGDWVLVKALSRVEILQEQYALLKPIYDGYYNRVLTGGNPLTSVEMKEMRRIGIEMDELSASLLNYGYTPYGRIGETIKQ